MIRPWYRSRLFWLGLPGWVFLLWLWFGCLDRDASATWITSDRSVSVGWGNSVVAVYYLNLQSEIEGIHYSDPGFSWHSNPITDAERNPLFTKVPVYQMPLEESGLMVGRLVMISNGFLALLYLLSWIGSVVFWQRRKLKRSAGLQTGLDS